jgi:hypothetical protein
LQHKSVYRFWIIYEMNIMYVVKANYSACQSSPRMVIIVVYITVDDTRTRDKAFSHGLIYEDMKSYFDVNEKDKRYVPILLFCLPFANLPTPKTQEDMECDFYATSCS